MKKDMDGMADMRGVKSRLGEGGSSVRAPGWGIAEMEESTLEKMAEELLDEIAESAVSWKSMPTTAMSLGLSDRD